MAETTVDIDALNKENTPSSYTTETEESAPGRGQSTTAPSSGLSHCRKAIAHIRLVPGTGQWALNGRSLEDHFPNKLHQQLVRAPLIILGLGDRLDVIARISGGGVSGQAGALCLDIARALSETDYEANRTTLKKADFPTRDLRTAERKKAGLHRARRASQYSKRRPGQVLAEPAGPPLSLRRRLALPRGRPPSSYVRGGGEPPSRRRQNRYVTGRRPMRPGEGRDLGRGSPG